MLTQSAGTGGGTETIGGDGRRRRRRRRDGHREARQRQGRQREPGTRGRAGAGTAREAAGRSAAAGAERGRRRSGGRGRALRTRWPGAPGGAAEEPPAPRRHRRRRRAGAGTGAVGPAVPDGVAPAVAGARPGTARAPVRARRCPRSTARRRTPAPPAGRCRGWRPGRPGRGRQSARPARRSGTAAGQRAEPGLLVGGPAGQHVEGARRRTPAPRARSARRCPRRSGRPSSAGCRAPGRRRARRPDRPRRRSGVLPTTASAFGCTPTRSSSSSSRVLAKPSRVVPRESPARASWVCSPPRLRS